MNDTPTALTQDTDFPGVLGSDRADGDRWRDSGKQEHQGWSGTPNWSRRKGLGQSSPTRPPLSCNPFFGLFPLPPSSVLLPWIPSEAQVTEHPLAEG